MRLYDDAAREMIAQLYNDGAHFDVIGARTGASNRTITKIAAEMGCSPRMPGSSPNSYCIRNRDRIERALVRYTDSDDPIAKICAEEGVTANWIFREVRRRGLKTRNQSIDCCDVAMLYRDHIISDVAKIIGASHSVVTRALGRHRKMIALGVPPERHEEMCGKRRTKILELMKEHACPTHRTQQTHVLSSHESSTRPSPAP